VARPKNGIHLIPSKHLDKHRPQRASAAIKAFVEFGYGVVNCGLSFGIRLLDLHASGRRKYRSQHRLRFDLKDINRLTRVSAWVTSVQIKNTLNIEPRRCWGGLFASSAQAGDFPDAALCANPV
jgi:hypothetical protein